MLNAVVDLMLIKPQLRVVDLSSNARVGDVGALLIATTLLCFSPEYKLSEIILVDTGMTRAAGKVRR